MAKWSINRRVFPALIIGTLFLSAFISRMIFFLRDGFATGNDGYFYVLQVFSLRSFGKTFFNDVSIVPYILNVFGIISKDIVFTNKVASALVSGLSVIPLYLVVHRLTGRRFIAWTAALLYAFNYSAFFLSMEFLKNNFGLMFFLWFLYFLLCGGGGEAPAGTGFRQKIRRLSVYLPAALFLLLSLLCHKMAGALSFIFLLIYPGARLVMIPGFIKKGYWKFLLILPVLLIILILLNLFSAATLRLVDLTHLLEELDIRAVAERYRLLNASAITAPEKTEFLIFHLMPLVVIPFLAGTLFKGIGSRVERAFLIALYIILLILINPLLKFGWDLISLRLLIVANIPAAIFAGCLLHRIGRVNRWLRVVPPVFLAILMFFNIPSAVEVFHSGRYPDYKALHSSFLPLVEKIPPGKRLISHRGISPFIWYITGIVSENFRPPEYHERYYRLVYALGPVHFKKYREGTSFSEPLRVHRKYTLMEEGLWQRFYEHRKGEIRFLKNYRNPFIIRPPAAYLFDEKKWTGIFKQEEISRTHYPGFLTGSYRNDLK